MEKHPIKMERHAITDIEITVTTRDTAQQLSCGNSGHPAHLQVFPPTMGQLPPWEPACPARGPGTHQPGQGALLAATGTQSLLRKIWAPLPSVFL